MSGFCLGVCKGCQSMYFLIYKPPKELRCSVCRGVIAKALPPPPRVEG
jgi:hypothetical protein